MSDTLAPGEPRQARRSGAVRRPRGRAGYELYAALDLGTNNCRLLIATRARDGFRVVDAYSRIVRLGEGLTHSGQLQPAAMDRALAALRVCAERIERRGAVRVRAVATQACRLAGNGRGFVDRVAEETGLKLEVISPREEARLSVAGCVNLIDRSAKAALVLDVGGGSTELSWVDLSSAPRGEVTDWRSVPPVKAWLSVPIGVVTLAEQYPEQRPGQAEWFRGMVDHVKAAIEPFRHADAVRPVFDAGQAHLLGTSGAITSLAGLHLGLIRYDRSRVDGLWLTRADCEATTQKLLMLDPQERAAQGCIGPDRADLVLAGAAILQAVQEVWPCARVRVADRGLREGLLLSLMSGRPGGRRSRRRGRQAASAAGVASA